MPKQQKEDLQQMDDELICLRLQLRLSRSLFQHVFAEYQKFIKFRSGNGGKMDECEEIGLLKALKDSNAGKDRVICDLIKDSVLKDAEINALRERVTFLEKWAQWNQKNKREEI